ncbi:MAG: sugar phosphate isomerase/epimerase [Granulosicoccus sp.]|nr:sugar phosphate isomerase/epimerase [Granulosicoccus sp.]
MATLGVHTFAFAPTWQPQQISAVAPSLRDHGVTVLEIPLLRPDEIDVAASVRLAREYDFTLVCSLGLPASLDIMRSPDEALAFLEPAFKVTQALGSGILSGVTYTTIGRTTGRAPTQEEKDSVCHFLESAARLAGRFNLQLGIEPCNRYETHLMNTAQQAVDYIERLSAGNVVIHLDTYHMHIEERDFGSAFATASPFLGYVHVSESNRGTPGQGMVDWSAVMQGLAAISYSGTLTLESMNHVDVDIAGALAIWRPVADNPDEVISVGLPFLKDVAGRSGLVLR